jgi:phosphoenolpyruvate carboxykinase (GTP)
MAMLPFCGYNFADYWSHWLSFERKTEKLPKIFHVNWFRQNEKGMFLWPGFNENLRVLRWIIDRCEEKIDAQETPIGFLPHRDDIDMNGLDIPNKNIDELLSVDKKEWLNEIQSIGEYIQNFGQRVPKELLDQSKKLEIELSKSST